MEIGYMILLFSCVLFLLLSSCATLNTISTNQVIKDGDTIVSDDNMFELGFFSPGRSKNRYVGIWYKKISTGTVVWVANRETPITDKSGMLELSRHGNLLIRSGDNTVIWSSNSAISMMPVVVVVQLLDTGNLVVWDRSTKNECVIWQSFDHPGNTFLPGMKFGKDLATGIERVMIPWKSVDDPSPGEYLHYLDTNGYPQMFVRKGSVVRWRYGPWNGLKFQGLRMENPNPIYSVQFVSNEKEIYYTYEITTSVVQRILVLPDDTAVHLRWMDQIHDWAVHSIGALTESCGGYGLCGPYGSCSPNRYPPCTCIAGFMPRVPDEWDRGIGSSGCERKRDLDCGSGSGFKRISGVIFPDTRRSWYNQSMTLEECEMACSLKCNCTAYANSDIRNGGSGCLLWFDELIDTTESDDKQGLYIKLAASELVAGNDDSPSSLNKKKKYIQWYRYALDKKDNSVRMEDLDELPLLSLNKIVKATDNFNINNKIGEGGYGPVYKGVLEDGQEVAVKRLSETSQQGIEEFKNEIICIAKLQHRNLVKLLGYCDHRNELILVYEYMTNKSLDLYLFDETRSSMLDWPQRFNIIQGMARGILYLHQDSRLQIIHRDLKAGNILLDGDMNPKISDFGLARKFVGSDTATNTKKVVGTHGYISPEYAVHGRFSIKSDVYSFGVLVLEIVSGRKNREFSHDDHNDNLLGHAWRLYKQGRSIELMCASLDTSCVIPEVIKSIHVALLCVQNHAKDRPTMLTVVLMLVSESVLPQPKQPAFYSEETSSELESVSSVDGSMITHLYAR
ncbi:G-type lectin S-receptor-like serine/threonine-protein kinase At4g27290 [Helianthus annuus]|uniref:G-type lectin S-receptor-like serine/threonine-protein kinase At4g27290 n=1 Tax=Helianthus annuus TaxID=4232 RepID=UPI001652F1F7|nr:G-type lectin S-receptor-like serine/threonine-protein kinase At4g27290 [Helianthus annuus]